MKNERQLTLLNINGLKMIFFLIMNFMETILKIYKYIRVFPGQAIKTDFLLLLKIALEIMRKFIVTLLVIKTIFLIL